MHGLAGLVLLSYLKKHFDIDCLMFGNLKEHIGAIVIVAIGVLVATWFLIPAANKVKEAVA